MQCCCSDLRQRCNRYIGTTTQLRCSVNRPLLRYELVKSMQPMPWNLYQLLGIILAQLGTHFEWFYFKKCTIFFKMFCCFSSKHQKLWLSQENTPMCIENGTQCKSTLWFNAISYNLIKLLPKLGINCCKFCAMHIGR